MSSKIVENSFKSTLAKSFYNYVKEVDLDDTFYASVVYIPDSEYDNYTNALDSDSDAEFFGGKIANDYDEDDKTFYSQNTLSMHKIFPGGVSRVAPRQDWTPNIIYPAWPDSDSHVLVKEYISGYSRLNVYRCLFCPNVESIYSPSGVSSSEIYLPDGYVWKYLYTISNSQAQKFLSDKWMPVPEKVTSEEAKTLSSTTNKYRQYVVQSNAQSGELFGFNLDSDALSGSVTSGNLTVAATMATGEKPSQEFEAVLSYDNTKNSVKASLTQKGKGYTGQIKFVEKGTTNVIAGLEGALLAGKGHGYDAASEMFSNKVLLVSRNIPDGDILEIIDDNRFNMITLNKNPIDATTNNIAEKDFYVACKNLVLDNNLFIAGDIIRPFPADDGRRGLVISSKGNKIYYTNYVVGAENATFDSDEQVSNITASKNADIISSNKRDVVFDSSELLLVDKKPTTLVRSSDQIESLTFILTF